MKRNKKTLLFLKGFLEDRYHTGALLPSSTSLAEEITRHIPSSQRCCILEVGAGTGVFTQKILERANGKSEVVVYECNPKFARLLEENFAQEKNRVQVEATYVQNLKKSNYFHHVVCGLPFNNFPVETIEEIFDTLYEALQDGGTLSYFEYHGIRRVKKLVIPKKERKKLDSIGQTLQRMRERFRHRRRRVVWRNFPPAVVWHLWK